MMVVLSERTGRESVLAPPAKSLFVCYPGSALEPLRFQMTV